MFSDKHVAIDFELHEYLKTQDKQGATLKVSEPNEVAFEGVGEAGVVPGFTNVFDIRFVSSYCFLKLLLLFVQGEV